VQGSPLPQTSPRAVGENTEVELARFLQIAIGSASETQYHLLLARELKLLKISDYERLEAQVIEVKRMLASLIQKLTTPLAEADS
jgi:four helix bundle protein